MKTNPLITQRFQELCEKGDAIAGARTLKFVSRDDGSAYYDINAVEYCGWETNVLSLLQRVFGVDSVHFQQFVAQSKRVGSNEAMFLRALEVFKASREDYQGGFLFKLQSLVRAEVLDDMLGQATALLSAGYKDPACVVAGVALETTLKDLCERDSIPGGKLDKMNADLAKKGLYNVGMQKQITAWAHLRNSAAHGDWGTYNEADVVAMIKGVSRLIVDYV